MQNCDTEKIATMLGNFIPEENIYINEPMSKHTSFKIGGNADIFVKVKTIEQIIKIIELANKLNQKLTIFGNGSNVLVTDKGIRGIVIKNCNENYEFIDDETIKVSSGMLNAKLAKILLDKSLSGFEFAAGIPGTIGGAVKMNAGAYGGQMQDIVVSTRYIELKEVENENQKNNTENYRADDSSSNINLRIKEINNKQHEFEYRKSIFSKKNTVILDTTLKLHKTSKDEIQEKMEQNNQSRKLKQPTDKPSAGSTFKRGADFVTAQLIDECGLKGYTVGGAQVSTKHAGFIINTGNATAEDVIKLTNIVKEKVYEKFNKKIELEIEILGE